MVPLGVDHGAVSLRGEGPLSVKLSLAGVLTRVDVVSKGSRDLLSVALPYVSTG